MKKRLCIGLISPSSILTSILDSIGLWYETVDFNKNLSEYILLIKDGDSSLENTKHTLISDFIENNGQLLEISNSPSFYSGSYKTSFKKVVLNKESNSVFDRISHLDIFSYCSFTSSSDILSGLIDFQKMSEINNLGFIGLDLGKLPIRGDYTRKRFLSPSNILPDELVNKVSYEVLEDIIELCIKELLIRQGLPFIKKWISPTKNPVFGFRIDSDYGTKESLKDIYSLLNKHSIKATWFLHVSAHKDWLDFFGKLNNQELALHGYNHGYSNSKEKIISNIAKGLSTLVDNEITPSGFCGPYGIWNKGLKDTLEKFEFEYTSEFTTGYDSVPFFIKGSQNLQIPIHPVCTGSLSRKRYSLEEIQHYFLRVYENKLKLYKPIIFYHHPLQIGLSVFDEIFKKTISDDLTNLTFEEYAAFWKERTFSNFSAYYDYDNKNLEIESDEPELYLYISNSQDSFDLLQSKDPILFKHLKGAFKYQTPSLPSLDKQQGLHHNRINLMKTSFIDWKNRHRL